MNRRSYALTLVACLAGAGLALYAASRTWSLHLTPRPGMSALREARTGADLEPWLIGLALVGLAGTGALLATSGRVRRGLGVLLALTGAGILTGAILGRAGLDQGEAGPVWPFAAMLGGVIVSVGGLTAARLGHLWPRMSSRYDRKQPAGAAPPQSAARETISADTRATWDALDRGDDPTAR